MTTEQEPTSGRSMPSDVEAERAVLGSVMLRGDAAIASEEITAPDAWVDPANRNIWAAIKALSEADDAIDLLTVTGWLRSEDKLERCGGNTYIAALMASVPTSTHLRYYAKRVQEKALARALIKTCWKVAENVFSAEQSPEELLDDAQSEIFALQKQAPAAIAATSDGCKTGYRELDDLMGPMRPRSLTVLGGRPGAGKSMLALNIAFNAARRGDRVLIASMEMTNIELATRLLAAGASVENHRLLARTLTAQERHRVTVSVPILAALPIAILDEPSLSTPRLTQVCRKTASQKPLGLVVVDYLQQMQPPKGVVVREQQVASVVRGLKRLAGEIDVPVLALAQLNRATAEDAEPGLSDLRESGAIEQEAHTVLFLYGPPAKLFASLKVAKNRGGKVGTIQVFRVNRYTRFEGMMQKERNHAV